MGTPLGKWIFAAISVVVGTAWVTAIVLVLHGYGTTPGVARAQPAAASASTPAGSNLPTRQFSLTLQTFPSRPSDAWMSEHHYSFASAQIPPLDAHPEWVTYGPTTNLVVPAHALITMTIQNYDSQTPALNPFVSNVIGTVGNTMTVNGKTVSGVDPNTLSHTFTIHAIPNSSQPWLYVSVPVVGEADNAGDADQGMPATPQTMVFSFVTGAPGTYIWQCFDPCGWYYDGFGGPMQTRGYMNGTLVVQG